MAGTIENAIAAIAAACTTLKVANGYSQNVQYVGRHPMVWQSLTSEQLPAVFVARHPEAGSPLKFMDKYLYEQAIHVLMTGFLPLDGLNPDDFKLATRAEAFLADLKRLQMADPTFGSPSDIHESKMVVDFSRGGWDTVGAIVGVELEVYCYFDGGTP